MSIVRRQVDRAEVADRGLGGGGVQGDLGAEVGAVDHAGVILRRAKVAGVLERDPRVPRLKEHRQHLAPELLGRQGLGQAQLPAPRALLVGDIGLFESPAEEVVQVRHLVRREERPLSARDHPFHEEVGDPVGRVHVVRAAAVVAGVLAQVEEVLDVVVPGLEVGAGGAPALAAAVDRVGHIVGDLEEGDHALALDVGAPDRRPGRADARPVVADAAGPLGELRVVGVALEDVQEVVLDRGDVAAAELGAAAARVEERGGAGDVAATAHQLVELQCPRLAVLLLDRQAHRHAHPECLRQLHRQPLPPHEVALVEGLQAEVLEVQVPLGLEPRGESVEVEVRQPRVVLPGGDAGADALGEGGAVDRVALLGPGRAADDLLGELLEQEAGGDQAVGRILLDEAGRRQDHRLLDAAGRDAVVDVVDRLADEQVDRDLAPRALGGPADRLLDALHVEEHGPPIALDHRQLAQTRVGDRLLAGGVAQLLALGAVEDVGFGDLVELFAHQMLFDDVLDVLDVGVEVDEAVLDLGADRLADPVERGVRDLVPGRPNCLQYRVLDSFLIEIDDVASALDDLEVKHEHNSLSMVQIISSRRCRRPPWMGGQGEPRPSDEPVHDAGRGAVGGTTGRVSTRPSTRAPAGGTGPFRARDTRLGPTRATAQTLQYLVGIVNHPTTCPAGAIRGTEAAARGY